jgi:hypothetical protein
MPNVAQRLTNVLRLVTVRAWRQGWHQQLDLFPAQWGNHLMLLQESSEATQASILSFIDALDEEALLEALGLGPNAPIGLVLFGSHNAQLSARARGPINWNLSTKTGWLGSTAASFERR